MSLIGGSLIPLRCLDIVLRHALSVSEACSHFVLRFRVAAFGELPQFVERGRLADWPSIRWCRANTSRGLATCFRRREPEFLYLWGQFVSRNQCQESHRHHQR